MNFYKQLDHKSCQVIALQTVLSFYDIYPTPNQIKRNLPKHSYGNTISELSDYLNKMSIQTRTILNSQFIDSAEEEIRIGYEDRFPESSDIGTKPVIINVDWYKIRNREKGKAPHYVVAIKEDEQIELYDGSNYSRKVKCSFDWLLNASKDINRFGHNGKWLVCT